MVWASGDPLTPTALNNQTFSSLVVANLSGLSSLVVGTDPGGAELLRVGGGIRIANNFYLWSKDTLGTSVRLIGIAADNFVYIGSIDAVSGTGAIHFRTDGADRAILTSTDFVLGTDPGGADVLRIGGSVRVGTTLGVNTGATSNVGILVTGTIPGAGTESFGLVVGAAFTGDANSTANIVGIRTRANSPAIAATFANLQALQIITPTIGAGSTVTTAYGINIQSITGAGANYAIFTNAGLVSFGDATTVRGATTDASLQVTSNNSAVNLSLQAQQVGAKGAIGMVTNHPLSIFANNLNRWQFDASGNLVADATNGGFLKALNGVICNQAALATGATTGFFYLSTSAGLPTGVPGAQTGTVAAEYDTTNDNLMVYNGAWKVISGKSHAVRVTKSAQSVPNVTDTIMLFATEDFDTDAFHDTVTNTGRLTVPTGLAGKYLVTGMALFAGSATGDRYIFLRKNGATNYIRDHQNAYPAELGLQTSAILNLAVGDYMELMVQQSSGGNLNCDAEFQMHFIGT